MALDRLRFGCINIIKVLEKVAAALGIEIATLGLFEKGADYVIRYRTLIVQRDTCP